MAREKPYREEWWDRDRIAKLDKAVRKDAKRPTFENRMSIMVDFGEDAADGFTSIGEAVQFAKKHCATGAGYIDPVSPRRREAAVLVNTDTTSVLVYRCQNNALDWYPQDPRRKREPWHKPGWTGRYRLGPSRGGMPVLLRAADRDAFLVA